MQTIKSFSAIADLLRAKAKQRSDDDEAEPRTDDDEKRDEVAEDRPPRKKMRAKDKDEEPSKENDEPSESGSSALTPARITALAQQIVNAGRQRRGEVPIENPPPIISEAARHAGTATYTTPVKDPAAMAAAIIAAAKKARTPT